ncbi:hypothetical protein GCM10020256_12970 [Streptomyces thermocoprophilus]
MPAAASACPISALPEDSQQGGGVLAAQKAQRLDLDAVADGGAGAVGLQEADRAGRQARVGVRAAHRSELAFRGGG